MTVVKLWCDLAANGGLNGQIAGQRVRNGGNANALVNLAMPSAETSGR